MPGSFIELTASDGFTFKAYKAFPEGTPKGAIVVIQEIFGVNANIREMTDRIGRTWLCGYRSRRV